MTRRDATLGLLVLCLACGDDGGADTDASDASTAASSATSDGAGVTTEPGGSSTTDAADVSSSDGGQVTTVGPGSCSGECAPPIPSGWTGPVRVGANAVDCNGAFADPAGAFFTDFDAGEDECTCNCGPVDVTCAPTAELLIYGEGGCAGDADLTVEVSTTACNPIEGPFPASLDDAGAATTLEQDFFSIAPVLVTGGTCDGEASFNEGGFGGSVQLCGPSAEPSMCDEGGPCIQDGSNVCIWQEGEHECPEAYPAETMGFGGSMDERECGACACGEPTGICDSSIDVQFGPACETGFTVTNADCTNSAKIAVDQATYNPGDITVECGGSGTAPISGEVAPTNPVTICCAVG